jgi:acetyl-CoA synthetase
MYKGGYMMDQITFDTLYKESVDNPDHFWETQAKRLHWTKFPTKIKDTSFDLKNFRIKWYEDGKLNACYNCLDRHLPKRSNDIAIIWEGDDPNVSETYTYGQLHEMVCRLANVLKKYGVKKGDAITLYMPMVVEAAVAMLACARIGAVHSVVFGGFSPESLANRIHDSQSKIVITANEGRRGGKRVPLKKNVDKALELVEEKCVEHVIVVRVTDADLQITHDHDLDFEKETKSVLTDCPCEDMDAEDPLFILYTSGSTGAPKGVVHTTGGYMVFAALTHEHIFDYKPGEVYWCTADVGWVTGHSYIVYGPLANGATSLMFEGIPTYPDFSRFWQVVDKHNVSIFYTAPTAIRTLMREDNKYVYKTSRKSLRVLGTVGEPINPEAWRWYHDIVGRGRCPIVDTWWQTETGGIMISALPQANAQKPGSATAPFFGIKPGLMDNEGKELEGLNEGNLVITDAWPGIARTILNDHDRFLKTYFTLFPGFYNTGDGARRDNDNDYWITGRVDDVINVSGHRVGTAEIESALVSHPAVSEAAVVGFPHDIKGQGIYAYATLMANQKPTEELREELRHWVRERIGPIVTPDHLQWAVALPKTRSGKIMRRILRKIAENDLHSLGDISTLSDPGVVDDLIKNRMG